MKLLWTIGVVVGQRRKLLYPQNAETYPAPHSLLAFVVTVLVTWLINLGLGACVGMQDVEINCDQR